MSGFANENNFWSNQPPPQYPPNNYYEADYNQFQNQQLDFKPIDEYGDQSYMNYAPTSMSYMEPKESIADDFDEPPLLEELEIYPDRILEKVKAALNPFRTHSLSDDAEYLTKDADIIGPVSFYLMLGVCLFLSGNKAQFGYIYGLSVLSSIFMYFLLTLMTLKDDVFTIMIVASVLGYCVLPIVALATIGVFFSLQNLIGIVFAVFVVLWSCVSASRLFVVISGDKQQQPLIAYPCALVAGMYVLLVVF